MRAYKCDRCGKLFEKYKDQGTPMFFNITRNQCAIGNSLLDLCPNCNDELQEWVTNDKVHVVVCTCIDALPRAESEDQNG